MLNMKTDKLQNRKLFRIAYEFAPGNFDYRTIGADKDTSYLELKIMGAKIYRNFYGKLGVSFREIIVLSLI